ncbi:MAG: hypothetical protein U0271_11155 [Polyangiaceae bacterium]
MRNRSVILCLSLGASACGSSSPRETAPTASSTAASSTAIADAPRPSVARRARPLYVGDRSACAVKKGAAYCWGDNERGLFMKGTNAPQALPVAIDLGPLNGAKPLSISLGSFGPTKLHGVALLDSGVVRLFDREGTRDLTELGDAVDVAASSFVVCSRAAAGAVTCVEIAKTPKSIKLPALESVVDLEGDGAFCALLATGKVVCWDYLPASDHLELSSGFLASRENLGVPGPVPGLDDATQIAVGWQHACAVRKGGGVVCWGRGDGGRLGGRREDSEAAVAVTLPEAATQVAAGNTHACAILQSGKVACWGKQGTKTGEAQLVDGVDHPRSIAAGGDETCVELESSEVRCWGENEVGQLGNGTLAYDPVARPVAGASDAASLALGDEFSCAKTSKGEVQCWGGARPETRGMPPVVVADAKDAASLVADETLTALFKNGGFQGFSGAYGMAPNPIAMKKSDLVALGDASLKLGILKKTGVTQLQFGRYNDKPKLETFPVKGLADAVDLVIGTVTAGAQWACALRSSGTVGCVPYSRWGYATDHPDLAVTEVQGISDGVALGAGAWRGLGVCVIRKTGGVVCLESNGEDKPSLEAKPVPGLEAGVVQLTRAQSNAICARKDTGAVECWGRNDYGQMGTGDYEQSDKPVAVKGLSDAVFIAAGRRHACAIRKGGQVVCFGDDSADQLGRSESSHPNSPVTVKLPD